MEDRIMWHAHVSVFVLFEKDADLPNTLLICLNVGTWPLIHVTISKYVLTKEHLEEKNCPHIPYMYASAFL